MKTPIIITYVTFGYALNWHKAKLIIFLMEYPRFELMELLMLQVKLQGIK